MAITDDQVLAVLVGPTCPMCESDDLRWRAPLGALQHGQCRDCGTEYRWYETEGSTPEPICPSCGLPHDPAVTGTAYCADCDLSDCAYCGTTPHRFLLDENVACSICERGEVDAA